jgi:hypothetical protein
MEVMKRKFGESTYSRNYVNLRKEMFLTAVTYNIYVDSRTLAIEVFYRAQKILKWF